MTFFTAPPSSQPTTSVLVYGRKYGVWQAAWSRWATASSRAGDDGGGRLPGGDLPGEVGAGDAPRRGPAADLGDLLDDLAHPLRGAEFDALHQGDEDGVRGQQRRPVGEVAAQRLRGDGEHGEVRVARRPRPGRWWPRTSAGSSTPGQVVGVGAAWC